MCDYHTLVAYGKVIEIDKFIETLKEEIKPLENKQYVNTLCGFSCLTNKKTKPYSPRWYADTLYKLYEILEEKKIEIHFTNTNINYKPKYIFVCGINNYHKTTYGEECQYYENINDDYLKPSDELNDFLNTYFSNKPELLMFSYKQDL